MPIRLKKLFLFLAIPLSGLIILGQLSTVLSQTPLQKAKTDYTFQLGKYQETKNRYQTTKTQYQSFKTAIAKNEAYLATKAHLTQIANVHLAYFFLVKENSNVLQWSKTSFTKEPIDKLLNSEVDYFRNFTKTIETAQTLEELVLQAGQLKKHLAKTRPKISQTIATFEIIETESATADFNSLTIKLGKMISQRSDKINPSVVANWNTEIANIRQKTEFYLGKAKEMLAKTQENAIDENQVKAISTFTTNAKNQLQPSATLFEEMIRLL